MTLTRSQLDELKRLYLEKIPFLPFHPVDEKDLEYARKFFDSYPALLEAAERELDQSESFRRRFDRITRKPFEDDYK